MLFSGAYAGSVGMQNESCIADFQEARDYYLARRFAQARAAMKRYQSAINYEHFQYTDNRPVIAPAVSVVVVSFATGASLLECLESVFAQTGSVSFEVIVVDNGGNEDVHTQLLGLPLLYVRPPVNLLPSEGRNIGAYFAKGRLLIFLDDDAVMSLGYIQEAFKAMQESPACIANRGRVLPKSITPLNPPPTHYDLGQSPVDANLNLEGNMVIRRAEFITLNGFDPILFGHEGTELSERILEKYPSSTIGYLPQLIIYHDYASADRLNAKHARQALATEYLEYLKAQKVKFGVSIVIRPTPHANLIVGFIESLTTINSIKPIEVLIFDNEVEGLLEIARKYYSKIFIRVVKVHKYLAFEDFKRASYKYVLLVDLPAKFNSNFLFNWIENIEINPSTNPYYSNSECSSAVLFFRDNLEDNDRNIIDLPINKIISLLKIKVGKNNKSHLLKNEGDDFQVLSAVSVKSPEVISPLEKNLLPITLDHSDDIDSGKLKHVFNDQQPTIYICILLGTRTKIQLDSTVWSVTRQTTTAKLKLLIKFSLKNLAFDAKLIKNIADYPWSERFDEIILEEKQDEAQKNRNLLSNNLVLTISAGDILDRNCVERLLNEHRINPEVEICTIALTKSKNGRYNPNPVIKKIFELPNHVLDIDHCENDNQYYSGNNLRKNLISLKYKGQGKKIKLVHDYLCELNSKDIYPGLIDLSKQGVNFDIEKLGKNINDKSTISDHFEKEIWLFGERAGAGAEENSWIFFQYCVNNAPEIECYYVINPTVLIHDAQYANRIVAKGTKIWNDLIVKATHFFFNDSIADILNNVEQLTELNNPVCVYLTHGVLSYSPGVYQKSHQYIDLVTVPSEHDARSAMKQWNFERSQFTVTGLARWDKLEGHNARREILFCPTWRKSLPEFEWDKDIDVSSSQLATLQESKYFQSIVSFLSSSHLRNILESNQISMVVSVHFRLRNILNVALNLKSDELIHIHDEKVDLRNMQCLLKDSAMLITDYSSIMWDMIHMNKPVILYQFDKPEMLHERGLNSFWLHDADKVFDICYTKQEVLAELDKACVRHFEISESKISAINKYLPVRDYKNCSRILSAVLNYKNIADQTYHSSYEKVHPLNINRLKQLILNKRVAGILGGYLGDLIGNEVTKLTPENLESNIKSGRFDLIIFEPSLDANVSWADIFFSKENIGALSQELINNCQAYGLELLPIITPYTQQVLRDIIFQMQLNVEYIYYNYAPAQEHIEISVIIPSFNSQKYLGDCLKSLVNQDFNEKYEIIIIDDGSTDDSIELIKSYQKRYPIIRYYWQPNARQGVARNYGIHMANGKYLTFVDSDDMLSRTALSDLYHSLKINRSDMAIGLFFSFDEAKSSRFLSQSTYHYLFAPELLDLNTWPALLRDTSPVAKLVKKSILLENNIFFSKSYHEDAFFSATLYANIKKISVINKIIYHYRGYEKTDGTKSFDLNKLNQILNVGLYLAKAYLNDFGRESKIFKLKIIDSITKYDRFMSKLNNLVSVEKNDFIGFKMLMSDEKIMRKLMDFCKMLDADLIAKYATMRPAFFLLLKMERFDLLQEIFNGKFDNANKYLKQQGYPCNIEMKIMRGSPVSRTSFDSYKTISIS